MVRLIVVDSVDGWTSTVLSQSRLKYCWSINRLFLILLKYLKERKKGKYSMISGKKIKMKVKKSKKDKQVCQSRAQVVHVGLNALAYILCVYKCIVVVFCCPPGGEESCRATWIPQLHTVKV